MLECYRPAVTCSGPAYTTSTIIPGAPFYNCTIFTFHGCRPFVYLSRRIEYTVGAGASRIGAYGLGIERPPVVAVQQRRVEHIAPGKSSAIASPRRFFPLRFAWQPPSIPGYIAQPRRISFGIRRTYQHYRVTSPVGRWMRIHPGKAPGTRIRMNQSICFPGRSIYVWCCITGCIYERSVLPIRDRCARDGVRISDQACN